MKRPAFFPVFLSCLMALTTLTVTVCAQPRAAKKTKSPPPLFSAIAGMDKPSGAYQPATSSHIELAGSRGEVLNFLIKIRQSGCHVLKNSSFSSPDGTSALFKIDFFQVGTITTTEPSYTGAVVGSYIDPVIPLSEKTYCGKNTDSSWLLAEVGIPRHQPPGRYTGNIIAASKPLEVTIVVWPMTMPEHVRLPMYAEMSTYSNLIGHHGAWANGEEDLAAQYNELLRAHHVYSLKSVIAVPPLDRTGEKPVIDIYTKPTPSKSFNSVVVKDRPEDIYYDFPTTAYSNMAKEQENDYYTAVEVAAKEVGRPGKAIVYLWDEPHEDVHERLLDLLKRVEKYAPSIKTLVTVPAYEKFQPYVDIFCPVMNQFDIAGFPGPEVYRSLQKKGKEIWWYVSCMSHGCNALRDTKEPDFVIERPSAWIRSIGWLSMKYSVDAFLYYMVNYGFNQYPARDPWNSQWDFSGNGDGTLLYPGRAGERGFEHHQPVASLRLKLWRETSFDAQYVQWMQTLKQPPSWWTNALSEVVTDPRNWSPNYSAYTSLRKRVGDYLATQMSPEKEATAS